MSRIVFILLLLPFTADAAFKDRVPVEVKAYNVVIDERLGFSTYTGDANIVQGDLEISAAKIQIFSKDQSISKVIAIGNKNKLAHYKQNQTNQPYFIEATAQNITYFIDKQLVRLVGEAHLVQGFESFSGGVLNYDIKRDKVIASKSKDGTQRVRFKIKL